MKTTTALTARVKYREKILALEKRMSGERYVLVADEIGQLTHSFADGMYIRELFVPKGFFVITKIHKLSHPCFVLRGECSVLTEEGASRRKAPYYMITPSGTKRVVYVHEDTVWVTVHRTMKTDLGMIEDEVIAKTFEDIDGDKLGSKDVAFMEDMRKSEAV